MERHKTVQSLQMFPDELLDELRNLSALVRELRKICKALERLAGGERREAESVDRIA
jgi:hypothetical protein